MNKLKKYKMSELYEMCSGISTTKEQAGHGTAFVSFSTVFNNYFLPDELPDLMKTSSLEQEKYSVKKGDVFLTRTSETLDELAMSSVAIKNYPNATFSGFVKRLRPIQKQITYDKFMAFYLRSAYFRKAINYNAVMTLRASFNEAIFSYLEIQLPDYKQQVIIGDFLHDIEEKIRINSTVNSCLESMAMLIFDYWFMQFNFPNSNGVAYMSSGGKMIWNDELNRPIPEKWRSVHIGEIFDFVKGRNATCVSNSESDKVPYLTIDVLKGGSPEFCSSENMEITNGDVLMVMDGASSCEVYVGYSGAVGSTLARLDIKVNEITNGFLYILMKKYEKSFKGVNTGSAIPHANKSYINDFVIPLPSQKEELVKIQKKIQVLVEKIIANRNENTQLKSIRDFLMPLLINGQVRIDK